VPAAVPGLCGVRKAMMENYATLVSGVLIGMSQTLGAGREGGEPGRTRNRANRRSLALR